MSTVPPPLFDNVDGCRAACKETVVRLHVYGQNQDPCRSGGGRLFTFIRGSSSVKVATSSYLVSYKPFQNCSNVLSEVRVVSMVQVRTRTDPLECTCEKCLHRRGFRGDKQVHLAPAVAFPKAFVWSACASAEFASADTHGASV